MYFNNSIFILYAFFTEIMLFLLAIKQHHEQKQPEA